MLRVAGIPMGVANFVHIRLPTSVFVLTCRIDGACPSIPATPLPASAGLDAQFDIDVCVCMLCAISRPRGCAQRGLDGFKVSGRSAARTPRPS